MEYKLRWEIQPNNPNLKCEKPVSVFSYDTKRNAHLYWLNCVKDYISTNTMFDESKRNRYKIITQGKIREVIDITDNSTRVRITKLY